ncbi:hypothetical protein GYMLUDRAFT_44899 [Collybiopsis luxurians FD-317 M1]|uniref:F-box domain-containing protein n=1 Tax=Collybiopsis luxurians FD-317 M1 TaxID=944289 RepID=A0A0D0CTP6_9AGAR|nr:hypothetical protein GYMLUDRAFT_44899 [Collybiopsis luxurians FD-317 M1]
MPICSICGKPVPKLRVDLDFTSLHRELRSESGPTSVRPDKVNTILENLQQDLKDVESAGRDIEEHQSCILGYTTQFRCLLSPVRKVPEEILQHIFDVCCDMNHFVASNSPPSNESFLRSNPAMALSSVCTRWRETALAMPSIWARISFQCRRKIDGHDGSNYLQLLPEFLNRSLRQPMIIDLALYALPIIRGYLHPVLVQLMNHRDRWQSLRFFSSHIYFESLFRSDETPQFPLLENLEIVDERQIPRPFINAAPRLKTLKMPLFYAFPAKQPPFSQVLHMEVTLERDHVFASLGGMPNLVSLVTKEYWRTHPLPNTSCLTLPSLYSLTVHQDNRMVLPDLDLSPLSVFPFFTLPSLKALHLEPAEQFIPSPGFWTNFNPFIAFVQRSSFPLTTLSLNNLALPDSNLVRVLYLVPTLQNLTVVDIDLEYDFSPITEQFIESLHASRNSLLHPQADPIVPRLRSLKLDTNAGEKFRDDLVVDMVCSRWIPSRISSVGSAPPAANPSAPYVDCLREFTMKFRNRQDPGAVYEPLEIVEQSGMMAVVLWMG